MTVRLTMGTFSDRTDPDAGMFSDRTDPDAGMFSGRVYDNGLLLNNKIAMIT